MANVLVVDDDPDFVEVVRTILTKSGHTVMTAGNGQQALKQVQASRPDVILLDVMMSYVIEGLTVARQLRSEAHTQHIPILVVSSLTGVQAADILPGQWQAAIDGWLSKPIKPAVLLEKINAVLSQQPS